MANLCMYQNQICKLSIYKMSQFMYLNNDFIASLNIMVLFCLQIQNHIRAIWTMDWYSLFENSTSFLWLYNTMAIVVFRPKISRYPLIESNMNQLIRTRWAFFKISSLLAALRKSVLSEMEDFNYGGWI